MNLAMPRDIVDVIAQLTAGASDYRIERLAEEGILALDLYQHPHKTSLLVASPATPDVAVQADIQLEHEFSLRGQLGDAWAVTPIALTCIQGQQALIYDDFDFFFPLPPHRPSPGDIQGFLTLALSICATLKSLHALGICHGNLKPTALFIQPDGRCKLGGFGLAGETSPIRQGVNISVCGIAPAYMSPEHTGRTQGDVDARSDLYSLGVVFYELLTGRLPFAIDGDGGWPEWVHQHIACAPCPPHQVQSDTPPMLSRILLKLLAKSPQERYQTVAGVGADLKRCLASWGKHHNIMDFVPGLHDTPPNLAFSRAMSTGAVDVRRVVAAFDEVNAGSMPVLVTICGPADSGKSMLIANVLSALRPKSASFAVGRITSSRRELPFAALSQAFRSLVLQVLGLPEAQVNEWRMRIASSLSAYAGLAINLVPELALLMEQKNPFFDIPAIDAQARFNQSILSLVKAFATPDRPLVLLIDDMHLIDPASMRLLVYLMSQPIGLPLLMVAAYRDPQPSSNCVFTPLLAMLKQRSPRVTSIVLAPLDQQGMAFLSVQRGMTGAGLKPGSIQAVADSRHPVVPNAITHNEVRELETVIKASRALSEEINLDRLIHTLMTMTLEHAGAQRGLLIRLVDHVPVIEASADTTPNGVTVRLQKALPNETDLPLSVLSAVIRTGQEIRLGTPGEFNPFSKDAYLVASGAAAICMPMFKQARLVGVLYLENRLMPDAFTAEHSRVIALLVAQAAVSLETATLYAELLEENLQRRRVESELRASQASLMLGEKISHTGSWRWKLKHKNIEISAEYARIFGLDPTPRVITFDDCILFIHPDDRQRILAVIDTAVRYGRSMQAEYRIVRADASVRYVAGIGEPVPSPEGVMEYFGTVTDITARREAEDAVRAAQADLARVTRATTVGQLTASIAHEINQPLMSIVSNAGASLRWLNRDTPQWDNVRSGLEDIVTEGRRAGEIIRSLQALTRNEAPTFSQVDLHYTAHHIIALSRSELERRRIVVACHLEACEPRVYGDKIQIQQVLLNLVINAMDAMAEVEQRPRLLTLTSANPEPGKVVFGVWDTGIGICQTMIDRLFEPFYTTKQQGMGMGLAISHTIIDSHQGKIAAARREPYGSHFSFVLPTFSEKAP